MIRQLPQELQDFLSKLPPSTQNNARRIFRSKFERIMKQESKKAAFILWKEFGIEIDIDYIPGQDDGEPPRSYEMLE